jgi:Spy/CpxP family protein refolding chaperone
MRRWFVVAALTAILTAPALAQGRDTTHGRGSPQQRAEMEQRFRARLAEVVRERLGLSADQVSRLQAFDRRFEPERQNLMSREMQARRSLRRQVAAGDTADQTVTAGLLDQMLAIQRERAELAAREQRELATFLTPVQRAQLLSLQADLHRRVMNVQRGGQNRPGGPGNKGPPRPRQNEK